MQKTPAGDSSQASLPEDHDAYAAMRLTSFRRFWIGNIVSILGMQMQSTTLVWDVYHRTGRAFDVGLVGLFQVIPVLSLALLAGHVADRIDRRLMLIGAVALSCTASLGLVVASYLELPIAAMFVFVFLVGVARAFLQPAKSSLVPQLVPRALFSNAVTWNLGGFQLAAIAGPALGGWLLAWTGLPFVVYLLQAGAATWFIAMLLGVRRAVTTDAVHEAATLKSLGEGVRFVWHNKVILGAMALDMFAVLLGGVTALLPIFASDILDAGKMGYGWMASAPAVGALAMSLALIRRKPMAKAGQTLLWAVAGFGVSIIVFGLSRSFPLSLAALFCTGAFDCISVVVRHTLVQMNTPDRMRGRVSAISGMFISASNELGEFESGVVASLTSPVVSVVAGGVGTIVVVVSAAIAVPQLRRYGRLDGKDQQLAEAEEVLEVR